MSDDRRKVGSSRMYQIDGVRYTFRVLNSSEMDFLTASITLDKCMGGAVGLPLDVGLCLEDTIIALSQKGTT